MNKGDETPARNNDPESEAIERAIRESVAEAIERHRRLGLPMVEQRGDEIVWVPADELPDILAD